MRQSASELEGRFLLWQSDSVPDACWDCGLAQEANYARPANDAQGRLADRKLKAQRFVAETLSSFFFPITQESWNYCDGIGLEAQQAATRLMWHSSVEAAG